jgi:large subunit ribosomal protein L6
MSRVAKSPVILPAGVTVSIDSDVVTITGGKGTLQLALHKSVSVSQADGQLNVSVKDGFDGSSAQAGTARALINNLVVGVSKGFERKLELVGVGYRAKSAGDVVSLTLGFSHPIDYKLPAGVTAETPSQTEIILRGADKQKVGQVASEIRAFRPPEPYKGKGVRYSDETVLRKEAKKK